MDRVVRHRSRFHAHAYIDKQLSCHQEGSHRFDRDLVGSSEILICRFFRFEAVLDVNLAAPRFSEKLHVQKVYSGLPSFERGGEEDSHFGLVPILTQRHLTYVRVSTFSSPKPLALDLFRGC